MSFRVHRKEHPPYIGEPGIVRAGSRLSKAANLQENKAHSFPPLFRAPSFRTRPGALHAMTSTTNPRRYNPEPHHALRTQFRHVRHVVPEDHALLVVHLRGRDLLHHLIDPFLNGNANALFREPHRARVAEVIGQWVVAQPLVCQGPHHYVRQIVHAAQFFVLFRVHGSVLLMAGVGAVLETTKFPTGSRTRAPPCAPFHPCSVACLNQRCEAPEVKKTGRRCMVQRRPANLLHPTPAAARAPA